MITYYSTNNKNDRFTLEEAVLKGMPSDRGLFMPSVIPEMSSDFFDTMKNMTFQEIAFEVAKNLITPEMSPSALKNIIEKSITFDAPLVDIEENTFVLELFHGPTLAFKDFGARFMASLMSSFADKFEKKLYILVATSGDTGSAVANGFLDCPNIGVIILYPSGKVSHIQEKQLTTIGRNITALEIEGTFDDCQSLVKRAFLDKEVNEKLLLTSANSINIGRLIPQTFYYFYGFSQLKDKKPAVFSVPSGNFGNLTAGLMAKKMGLPVSLFIASTNINDIVPEYLNTGIFTPRPSKKTISNAMDVGNPSNFARMLCLYSNDVKKMKEDVRGYSFTDEETKEGILQVYKTGYLPDPHGTVGYLGLMKYREEIKEEFNGIFLETAHPGKFSDIIETILNKKIDIPERLGKILEKDKKSVFLKNDFDEFKSFLVNLR